MFKTCMCMVKTPTVGHEYSFLSPTQTGRIALDHQQRQTMSALRDAPCSTPFAFFESRHVSEMATDPILRPVRADWQQVLKSAKDVVGLLVLGFFGGPNFCFCCGKKKLALAFQGIDCLTCLYFGSRLEEPDAYLSMEAESIWKDNSF